MVCRPLLPRLARTVIDDQDAVAMHSMNDGFGYCCSCAERTDTTDPFQQCGKRTACRTMDFGGRDPVTYGSCRYSRTPAVMTTSSRCCTGNVTGTVSLCVPACWCSVCAYSPVPDVAYRHATYRYTCLNMFRISYFTCIVSLCPGNIPLDFFPG